MKNEIVLKKIPLKPFIDHLIEAYNEGAEFIDLVGIPGYPQDAINIITGDYPSMEPPPLTDETIDHLI